jgi:monovalent cation:H+ antiporter-2, CPA2 family
LLPGMGEPTPFELDAASPAVGKSLAELNLRGQTGATVLVIQRGLDGLLVPTASEVLLVGDRLALAGSRTAIAAAKHLLGAADAEESA